MPAPGPDPRRADLAAQPPAGLDQHGQRPPPAAALGRSAALRGLPLSHGPGWCDPGRRHGLPLAPGACARAGPEQAYGPTPHASPGHVARPPMSFGGKSPPSLPHCSCLDWVYTGPDDEGVICPILHICGALHMREVMQKTPDGGYHHGRSAITAEPARRQRRGRRRRGRRCGLGTRSFVRAGTAGCICGMCRPADRLPAWPGN